MNRVARIAQRSAWVLLLTVACAPNDPTKAPPAKYQLEGSTTQLFDLGYDEARILQTDEDVALVFVRKRPLNAILPDGGSAMNNNQGVSEDYPLKVTYALWGDPLPVKKRVDLAEMNMAMQARAVISRDVLNDPRKTYPTVERGTLIFNQTPKPGGTVSGDFNITFTNGVETASGRTVFGSFSAKVPQ